MSTSATHETWEVKLTGPRALGSTSLLALLNPWSRPEWRQVTIRMRVGTEECPDWSHVNLCMTAIQELVAMANGTISDDVLAALRPPSPCRCR